MSAHDMVAASKAAGDCRRPRRFAPSDASVLASELPATTENETVAG